MGNDEGPLFLRDKLGKPNSDGGPSSETGRRTRPPRIALAGNPNSGKTTLFNRLTGARQHVANYPGVTIEKRTGLCRHKGRSIEVTDLPGTYSLTAYSLEEIAARDFILDERPDVVIDVLDASNLERNLYLAVQLMELGVPVVLALNMSDQAKARGMEFDVDRLSERLGAPLVPTVGVTGEGVRELLDKAVEVAENPQAAVHSGWAAYGSVIGAAITAVAGAVERQENTPDRPPEWVALKLLEQDEEVRKDAPPAVAETADLAARELEERLGDAPEHLITEARYRFISEACSGGVRTSMTAGRTASDRLDAVLTHRWLGPPIFLALMYLVFQLTFTLGGAPMEWIETGFGWLGGAVSSLWPAGSESALRSLLVDGVIGGMGGVIVFLPNILLLFLAIAILEDSGYMARVAFLMDRVMHKAGLHGKSFIPLLTGFGCSVPAIMATRTIEGRRDRLTTIMVTPLMSCGARLPIYALLIPAFFPAALRAPMLWLIYLIGITLAIVGAKLLRATVLKGPEQPFLLELPPYRLPTLRSVLLHMWNRAWLYLRKAGTVILCISILLWALTRYPQLPEQPASAEGPGPSAAAGESAPGIALAHSYAGRIGRALEPALEPLGFDWRIGTALIGAFAAKEVFVAQLGIVFSIEEEAGANALRDKLRGRYSTLTAFCIMLFCLVSAPCMATLAVTRSETASWRWALFQFSGLTALAYGLTLLVYQFGSLLGAGAG